MQITSVRKIGFLLHVLQKMTQ